MSLLPRTYLKVLERGDFLKLILNIVFVQLASSLLLLSLIVSVFLKTGSNFGVSGVILSLAIPSFLLMAFAGVAADIFDRKKILIFANLILVLVVLLILLSVDAVLVTIGFAFLYFAGNSFFLPAWSAASAQLVKKSQLLAANSIFVFILAAGQIGGLFLGAVVHFFFGERITFVLSELLLVLSLLMATFLPSLSPRKNTDVTRSLAHVLKDMTGAFFYIFHKKIVWIFLIVLSSMQGVIAFGVTLAPGFFDEVVGISIVKSPMLMLPFLGLGVVIGSAFVHLKKIKEGQLMALGLGSMGLAGIILSLFLKSGFLNYWVILFLVAVFLVILGFGVDICIIISRTVLQKDVSYSYQGTLFGIIIILSAAIASVVSPGAAFLEALLGYLNLMFVSGLFLVVAATLLAFLGKRWQF